MMGWDHSITEWPGLKRTTMIIWFQLPCYVQGCQPADQAAQSHIQPGMPLLPMALAPLLVPTGSGDTAPKRDLLGCCHPYGFAADVCLAQETHPCAWLTPAALLQHPGNVLGISSAGQAGSGDRGNKSELQQRGKLQGGVVSGWHAGARKARSSSGKRDKEWQAGLELLHHTGCSHGHRRRRRMLLQMGLVRCSPAVLHRTSSSSPEGAEGAATTSTSSPARWVWRVVVQRGFGCTLCTGWEA